MVKFNRAVFNLSLPTEQSDGRLVAEVRPVGVVFSKTTLNVKLPKVNAPQRGVFHFDVRTGSKIGISLVSTDDDRRRIHMLTDDDGSFVGNIMWLLVPLVCGLEDKVIHDRLMGLFKSENEREESK